MEIYPTIRTSVLNEPIIAFDKIDGSNIRAEWSRKQGFTKFGTRHRLLDPNEKILGEAVHLFNEKYADNLSDVFRKQRFERATAFLEFSGLNSFAGFHEQEEHDVMLFDVHVYKQGLLTPKEFLKIMPSWVETAPVLYEGKASQKFVDSVRDGSLPGMTFEGVVCKGGRDNRGRVEAFKVKNRDWLNKLKTKFADNESMFEKLK